MSMPQLGYIDQPHAKPAWLTTDVPALQSMPLPEGAVQPCVEPAWPIRSVPALKPVARPVCREQPWGEAAWPIWGSVAPKFTPLAEYAGQSMHAESAEPILSGPDVTALPQAEYTDQPHAVAVAAPPEER